MSAQGRRAAQKRIYALLNSSCLTCPPHSAAGDPHSVVEVPPRSATIRAAIVAREAPCSIRSPYAATVGRNFA